MVKLLTDFLTFLLSCAPLLTSVAVFALLSFLLTKSIKKHSRVYYIILAIPFLLVAIPAAGRIFGLETFNFTAIPLLGQILRDYIHMGTFGHPLLIIIMYTGALDPKVAFVKRLMSIRRELSIISGFPVLTHSLVRVANNFPGALRFFTDNEEYMATTKVASELGTGICSFSLVFGIILLVLFLPLWITSFNAVHRRMGNVRWKKLQKWAYVLYAALFIHAVGIQAGGMLNPRAGAAPRQTVEAAESRTQDKDRGSVSANVPNSKSTVTEQQGGHAPAKGFADFTVPRTAKQHIHLISLVLVYGSYLCLRLRKAKKDNRKRQKAAE
jgi:DMSO/TMAO reductase YedYZ heme-binding membrane subunit